MPPNLTKNPLSISEAGRRARVAQQAIPGKWGTSCSDEDGGQKGTRSWPPLLRDNLRWHFCIPATLLRLSICTVELRPQSVDITRLRTHIFHHQSSMASKRWKVPEYQWRGFFNGQGRSWAGQEETNVLFVDFLKAFDIVDRPLLLTKLSNRFKIKGRMLGIIKKGDYILAWNELNIWWSKSTWAIMSAPWCPARQCTLAHSIHPLYCWSGEQAETDGGGVLLLCGWLNFN